MSQSGTRTLATLQLCSNSCYFLRGPFGPGLRGVGAAALFNLMEDAATAEISRSQVWQWIRYGVSLEEGPQVTRELVERYLVEELEKIRAVLGPAKYDKGRFNEAVALFKQVSLGQDFVEFLTLPAYRYIASD